MGSNRENTKLLEKVLADLKEFLPYLILVGGWAPFLYSKYLWKIRYEPVSTADIDLGFCNADYNGKVTVAEKVQQKNYREHHPSMDRLTPFVPVVNIGKISADIEFITSPKTSKLIKEKLIGKEIKINTIKDFDILFQKPISIRIGMLPVSVPDPAVFTFHKLLTFSRRGIKEKRLKDLYYAYYILFFSPEKKKLVSEISMLIKKLRQGKQVKKNIEEYFEDENDRGPFWIEEISRGSVMETLVENIRKDAFERIGQFIS